MLSIERATGLRPGLNNLSVMEICIHMCHYCCTGSSRAGAYRIERTKVKDKQAGRQAGELLWAPSSGKRVKRRTSKYTLCNSARRVITIDRRLLGSSYRSTSNLVGFSNSYISTRNMEACRYSAPVVPTRAIVVQKKKKTTSSSSSWWRSGNTTSTLRLVQKNKNKFHATPTLASAPGGERMK